MDRHFGSILCDKYFPTNSGGYKDIQMNIYSFVRLLSHNYKVSLFIIFLLPKVNQTDIESHQPAIESVITAASQVIESSEPEEADALRSRLDRINTRYDTIAMTTDNHGHELKELNNRLSEFEREVDSLEDWVLPNIEVLEAKDLMKMDMSQLTRKLNVSQYCIGISIM